MNAEEMATRITEAHTPGAPATLLTLFNQAGLGNSALDTRQMVHDHGAEVIEELKNLGWTRTKGKGKKLCIPPARTRDHAHTDTTRTRATPTRPGVRLVEATKGEGRIPHIPLTPPSPPFPHADAREKNPELEKACLDLLLRWRVKDARDWIESLGPEAVAAEINAIKRDFPGFPDSEAVRRPGALMFQRLQQAQDAQELMPQQAALDIVGSVKAKATSSYWSDSLRTERGSQARDFDQAVFEESLAAKRGEHWRQREQDESERLAAISGDPAYTKSAFVEKFVNGFGDAKRMPI